MDIYKVTSESSLSTDSFSFFDLHEGIYLQKSSNQQILTIHNHYIQDRVLQLCLGALEDVFPVETVSTEADLIIKRRVRNDIVDYLWNEQWWRLSLDFLICSLCLETGKPSFQFTWKLTSKTT